MTPADIPSVRLEDLPADALLLDVREGDEWTAGHVEGAVHVPMNEVPSRVAYDPGPITPERPVYVMCKAGGRSAQVTGWLNRNGYDAINVDGGMLAWATAHRPMVSEDGSTPTVV